MAGRFITETVWNREDPQRAIAARHRLAHQFCTQPSNIHQLRQSAVGMTISELTQWLAWLNAVEQTLGCQTQPLDQEAEMLLRPTHKLFLQPQQQFQPEREGEMEE